MKTKSDALAYLRKLIEIGYKDRELFLGIVLDQDDWLGALMKPITFENAVRLDAAQEVMKLFTDNPRATVEQILAQVSGQLDQYTLDLKRGNDGVTRIRYKILHQIEAGLIGTPRLYPRITEEQIEALNKLRAAPSTGLSERVRPKYNKLT